MEKQDIKLYQPDKYRVFVGQDGSTALCTVWNNPETICRSSSVLRRHCGLVGSLYSRYGVNVILRNLALNPDIRRLYLWGHGPLSNTEYGKPGAAILKALWSHGIGHEGKIQGTDWSVEKKIDPQVISHMVRHIELVDVSRHEWPEVERLLSQERSASRSKVADYMEPHGFPAAEIKVAQSFPSEEVGWLVRGRGILETWSRVVERIMRYGSVKGTQYGYQQRELVDVTWVIDNEDPCAPDLELSHDWPEEMRKTVGADREAIDQYQSNFLSAEPSPQLSYTYGNRLQRYPSGERDIDQIEEVIISQLKSSPDSRRAVAITTFPPKDTYTHEPPCLTQIQALQTHGRLHLIATFRSHDIFKAAVPNVFALRLLQKKIADRLGWSLGQFSIHSQSAHIYEQDWEWATGLARCRFWERKPDIKFDHETQPDPRGLVLIDVLANKLRLTLQHPDGDDLVVYEARTAAAIKAQICHLDLLSRVDHLMDIGMELQKAEIALTHGFVYTQDQPLKKMTRLSGS